MSKTTRREFLKIGLAAAGGALAASGMEIPLFSGSNSSMQTQLSSAKTQLSNLQNQLKTLQGFLTLNMNEQALLEPVVETIIPSDSTGPGAKEAGVIYFIDRALAGDYGQSANMFMDAPHIPPNIPAIPSTGIPLMVSPSLTWAFLRSPSGAYSVAGGRGSSAPIAYSGNGTTTPVIPTTASPRVGSGINYQYGINLREFWRASLVAFSGTPQSYSNKEYGGDFQTLSSTNQLQALKDLWSNAPKTKYATSDDLTGFSNILPSDFAYELTFMTWAGFLMDPLYGGNQNMVGWDYVGYNGVNFGNFYGEGFSQKDLMVAKTPTKLKPASLAQYQKAATGGA